MLGLFCFVNFCNAALWVTFAPISDLTVTYIGGSVGNITSVNFLATIFLIIYLPGSILGVVTRKMFSLRTSLIIAGFLSFFGSLIRLFGALAYNSSTSGGIYSALFIGQCISALAQPMFINIVAYISMLWFPESERDFATTIGSMFSPLGNALGQILPPAFVSQSDDGSIVGMSGLQGVECALCAVSLLLVIIFFQSEPPTPPSTVALNRSLIESNVEVNNDNSTPESADHYSSFKQELTMLFTDRNFVILFTVFSLGLGLFNALLTLLFQFIQPYGYSNDDAGNFGAAFIVAGLIGSALAGWILNKYKRYNLTLKVYIVLVVTAILVFVCELSANNLVPLLIAFIYLGATMLPLLPIFMETCAETTYPVSEDVSVGALLVGGNIFGVAFIFALQVLIQEPAFGPPPLAPASLLLLGLCCLK